MKSPYLAFNGSINDWMYFERLLAARLPEWSRIVSKWSWGRFLFAQIQLPGESLNFSTFRFNTKEYKMQQEVASTKWE